MLQRLEFTQEEKAAGVIAVLGHKGYEKMTPAGKGAYPYACEVAAKNPQAMVYKGHGAWLTFETTAMRESWKRHYVPHYFNAYKGLI